MDKGGNVNPLIWPLPTGLSLKTGMVVFFHLFLVGLVGYVAYSNTFEVPFIWDDSNFIGKNPAVADLAYFLDPSALKNPDFYTGLKGRYIGYLSFALNYKLHGLDVRGYHIMNISIHLVNAILVYLLIRLTFLTPFLGVSPLRQYSGYLALVSALIFVTHPVQTEAVTYIFQRFASLMTFFYLLSFVSYVISGLSTAKFWRYFLFCISLLSAVLAMKTKENAFTLPVVIVLYEFLFFRSCKSGDNPKTDSYAARVRRLFTPLPLRLIPFSLTMLIVPMTLIWGWGQAEDIDIVEHIDAATRGYTNISRWEYFLTQIRAVVTYIRLIFLPVNQNIDYHYPISNSFFSPEVFMSFLFLLSVFALAMYLLYSSDNREALSRLAAFGVLWFFIALAVESSLIPLPTLINEYRLYLPSMGVFLAVLSGTFIIFGKLKSRKLQAVLMSAITLVPVLLLLNATYQRNHTFRSMVSIWEDAVKKSPRNPRAHYNLGVAHQSEGRYDAAVKHFYYSLKLDPDCEDSHFNLGVIFYNVGFIDKAIEHYLCALKLNPDAATHNNLGVCYSKKGMKGETIEHFRQAVELDPLFTEARFNLGLACLENGRAEEAKAAFESTLERDPDHKQARYYLDMFVNAEKGLIGSFNKSPFAGPISGRPFMGSMFVPR